MENEKCANETNSRMFGILGEAMQNFKELNLYEFLMNNSDIEIVQWSDNYATIKATNGSILLNISVNRTDHPYCRDDFCKKEKDRPANVRKQDWFRDDVVRLKNSE